MSRLEEGLRNKPSLPFPLESRMASKGQRGKIKEQHGDYRQIVSQGDEEDHVGMSDDPGLTVT